MTASETGATLYFITPAAAAEGRQARSLPATCRRVFEEPGRTCVVHFGEFQTSLAPQMANPERLRAEHLLPCFVQVVESRVPESLEAVAQALFGQPEAARELFPLTESVANRLELDDVRGARSDCARQPGRRPGWLLPGDLAFRLRLAEDPMVQTREPESEPEPAAATAPALDLRKKSEIPERFRQKSFLLSREEASAELATKPSLAGRLENWKNRAPREAAYQRWQRELWNKESETQIWGVHPPRGLLNDARVRDWARCALDACGYDVASMLHEWEIYWRRQGV